MKASGRAALTPFVPDHVEGMTTDPISWTYKHKGNVYRGPEVLRSRTGADTLEPWKGI